MRFDRGTLDLGSREPDLPTRLWDPRTSTWRAAAYRHGAISEESPIAAAWVARPRALSPLALRSYQEQALASWNLAARRGVVALPTGAGKTRVALAAIFETGFPTAILCPTRVLASAWVSELRRWFGEPIGLVGDGERRVERLTVMTFESAFRRMDELGDRFGLLVVDEVHHFGSGARAEALEASAAIARLGLTATAPQAGSEDAARLEDLVGPLVFEMGFHDLVGKHLAALELVRITVRLEPDERSAYDAGTRTFRELRRVHMKSHPGDDLASMLRAVGRTPEGARALRDHARALELASFPRAKRALVRTLLERHRGDRTIVFTAFAENAYDVAFDNLVPVIAAETGAREREDVLARFRDGRVRAIACARVLNEGIDVPEARVAVIVAGTLGPREHVQRIGRVLRPGPAKRALVYELVTAGTSDACRAATRARHVPSPVA
jgi:superfamily II DNA or RNA helicase